MSPYSLLNLLFYLSLGNNFLGLSLKIPFFSKATRCFHKSSLQANSLALSINENTPDRRHASTEIRQIFLDTETTGLRTSDKHRIIEVAAVEMINQRCTGKYLHYYLNPERGIDARALQIHGINETFLLDKPKFRDIADELRSYLQGSELIMHNAPFDVDFLNYEFRLLGQHSFDIKNHCKIIDTLNIARKKHPGKMKKTLDALCQHYRIDNSARNKHGALVDAQLLSQVYLAMSEKPTDNLIARSSTAFFSKYVTVKDFGGNVTATITKENSSPKINEAINAIIGLNLTIEMRGTWVWVTGDTKPQKEALKAAGYKWSPKKVAWYLKPEDNSAAPTFRP